VFWGAFENFTAFGKKSNFFLDRVTVAGKYAEVKVNYRMNASLEFDPTRYSEPTLRLIMLRAQEWKVTPAEAVSRLLDQVAAKSGLKPRRDATPQPTT
jgi:hypothetical protein